jgi:hypothetical protein
MRSHVDVSLSAGIRLFLFERDLASVKAARCKDRAP